MAETKLHPDLITNVLRPYHRKAKMGMVMIIVGAVSFCLMFVVSAIAASVMEKPDNVLMMSMLFGIVMFLVGIVGGAVYHGKARKEYVSKYKVYIGKPVLESMFERVIYNPDRGFSEGEFRAAHLIRWKNNYRYRSEDWITGVHRGISFQQSDVHIEHEERDGDNRKIVTDISGRIWEFDWPVDVHSRVLIVKDWNHESLEHGLNKIELEDVDFNKKFDVYAEDEHSAFYLLTPHFMECVKGLNKYGRDLYISFDGKKLYILISGIGGIFEPADMKLDVPREIECAKKQLNMINEIIDALKLDQPNVKNSVGQVKVEKLNPFATEPTNPKKVAEETEMTEETPSSFSFKLRQ